MEKDQQSRIIASVRWYENINAQRLANCIAIDCFAVALDAVSVRKPIRRSVNATARFEHEVRGRNQSCDHDSECDRSTPAHLLTPVL